MRKLIRPLLALVLMLIPMTAAASEVQSILAVVNGEIITSYDFNQRWSGIYSRVKRQYGDKVQLPELQTQLLDIKKHLLGEMVDELIVAQEAKRMGIEVPDSEVDAFIENIKKSQQLDAEGFKAFLQRNNLTEAELKKSVKDDLVKRRMVQHNVSSRIVITDQEIADEYQRRNGASSGQNLREVSLSVIMAPDKEAMDKIVEAIDGGMSFAEAADKFSVGPAVGAGGALGKFSFKDLAATWRDALKDVKKGEMSKPFAADDKMVLLQVTDEGEGAAVAQMDQATHDAIYEDLRKKKYDELFDEFMNVMRERAVIEYKK